MKNNIQEIQTLVRDLKQTTAQQQITNLHRANGLWSICAFGMDWSLIIFACFLATKGWVALICSLVIIGSRQRALSNLVHDSSHRNLFVTPKLNDVIGNFFAAFAMFDTVAAYRKSHLMHHRFLGDTSIDPDAISHGRYGYDDQDPVKEKASKTYASLLLNERAFLDSVSGNLRALSLKERMSMAMWWGTVTVGSTLFFGGANTFLFILMWVVSRGTSYHVIRIFAEFLDHTGLDARSTIKFTRNLPHQNVWAFLLHPHQDTYHLAHHIFMGVPHYKLREIDALLMKTKIYREAHHCDSYFIGNHSAVSCWIGNCKGNLL